MSYLGMFLPFMPLLPLAKFARADGVLSTDCLKQCTSLFSSFDNAAHIGRRYLDATPGECETAVLASNISKSVLGAALKGPFSVGRDRFNAEAAYAVQRDFEIGNVVMIDGWMLSRTEAQICGLVALRRASPIAQI